MIIGGHTHIGRVRTRNEDAIGWDDVAGVAVIADGMGGHPAGDVASRLAVATALKTAREQHLDNRTWLAAGGDPEQLIYSIHQAILAQAEHEPRCAGMGTTLVFAATDERRVVIAHVGDSRAYRLHQGQLSRLTRDHNLAQEALEQAWITPEQARCAPQRHRLTQALGIGTIKPDVMRLERIRGDLIILCTDGLTGELPDSEIQQQLTSTIQGPQRIARQLVRLAVDCGGNDNVSVVVLQL
ncbi:MAG TPA: protein phosphatase 2C domain-containing protein [Nitrococcus sp.]|nr:protein phosphatase 2C domain-containing protein [Nitrococcus sp.]